MDEKPLLPKVSLRYQEPGSTFVIKVGFSLKSKWNVYSDSNSRGTADVWNFAETVIVLIWSVLPDDFCPGRHQNSQISPLNQFLDENRHIWQHWSNQNNNSLLCSQQNFKRRRFLSSYCQSTDFTLTLEKTPPLMDRLRQPHKKAYRIRSPTRYARL